MQFLALLLCLVAAFFSAGQSSGHDYCSYDCRGTCNGTAVPDCLGDCGGPCNDPQCRMSMGSCDMDKFVVLATRLATYGPDVTTCADKITYKACVTTAASIVAATENSTCV